MVPWFAFLRLESDLAMTFIDSARLHTDPADAAISLGRARQALAEIQRSLVRPASRGLSEDEIFFLEQRRTQIEAALTKR